MAIADHRAASDFHFVAALADKIQAIRHLFPRPPWPSSVWRAGRRAGTVPERRAFMIAGRWRRTAGHRRFLSDEAGSRRARNCKEGAAASAGLP